MAETPLSRPTKEQLETLTRMERTAFEIGDFWSRHLVPVSKAYNTVVMGAMLWSTASRRLNVHDLHHLSRFRAPERVLIVCNHRTFFDFFVITAVIYWRTELSRRILFPVRSTFFYDHPLGPLVNVTMSGHRMFPPVLRTESVRRRGTFKPSLALRARSSSTSAGDFVPAHRFNEYSVQRSIEELAQPGTVMGLHPEGTRNKTSDPYHFLRARAGVGRIALASPHARIIPAFVLGMGNDLPKELVYNWMRPKDTRIDVLFGPEIDLGDLRMLPQSPAIAQRASERMLDAIRVLADKHRALVGAPRAPLGPPLAV